MLVTLCCLSSLLSVFFFFFFASASFFFFFFFQAEDGIRDLTVTGVQTCALPIFLLGVASLVGLERGGAWLAWPAVLAVSVPLAECGLTVTRRLLLALAIVRPGSARERFLLRRGRAGLFEIGRASCRERV